MPVVRPKPNRRTHLSKRSLPSLSPIITEPTFEDWARISDTVSVSAPRAWASPIVRSATWIWGGRSSLVVGLISFSSSAPATVNALNVDPGS